MASTVALEASASPCGGDTWRIVRVGRRHRGADLNLYREDRIVGKTTLDWQADRYNRIKLGGELTGYSLTNYAFQLRFQVRVRRLHREADPVERVRGGPARSG